MRCGALLGPQNRCSGATGACRRLHERSGRLRDGSTCAPGRRSGDLKTAHTGVEVGRTSHSHVARHARRTSHGSHVVRRAVPPRTGRMSHAARVARRTGRMSHGSHFARRTGRTPHGSHVEHRMGRTSHVARVTRRTSHVSHVARHMVRMSHVARVARRSTSSIKLSVQKSIRRSCSIPLSSNP